MLGNVPFAELITFTRASVAWRFNASGILVQDAINVARFDTDPVTLQPRGMLVEEARTNYALWCRDLTNAAWSKTNCTAAKTSTGLDGVVNSSTTLTATAPNGICLQAITRSSAQRITGLYIRRRTGSGVVNMTQNGGSTWTPVTVTGAFTLVSVPAATAANPSIGLQIVTSGDAVDVDFVSHEESGFLTSPILTTTAAAARSEDSAVITDLSKIGFNPLEGSLYVEALASQSAAPLGTETLVALTGASTSNRITLYRRVTTGVVGSAVVVGGVSSAAMNSATVIAPRGLIRAAMSYRADDFAFSVNGEAPIVDTSGALPVVDRLRFGGESTTANVCNGHIRAVRYWPRRLSNAELQAITA